MQLNKFLAHAGICSRRKAAELIKEGKVLVNGNPVLEPGYHVKHSDVVKFNNEIIRLEEKIYVLLNKPKGYITTVADERGRKTVIDLVQEASRGVRLYPVGRLDRDTTGLLVLTNDGELAQVLAHPRYEVQKVYHVTLDRVIGFKDLQQIREGLVLEDGPIEVDSVSYIPQNPRNRVRIELHSGKNRIVRRIFEHLGYHVEKLDRVNYAGFSVRDLPRGAWRYLTRQEVIQLKQSGQVSKNER
jgi:23S rRNA pseudouridine2605 synthase